MIHGRIIKYCVSVLLLMQLFYAQTVISNNTMDIKVSIPIGDYTVKDSAGYKFIDFYASDDPSRPGEFTLPEKHLIIAIPPNSNPTIDYQVLNSTKLEKTIPNTNAEIFRKNDSTIVYKKTSFRDGITNYIQKPVVELGEKFWLRDFYCVEVIIHSHQFNVKSSSITVNTQVDLSLSLVGSSNFAESSPIKVKSKFDVNLSNIIYNYDVAEQFRSTQVNEISSDNSNSWINYSSNYVKLVVAEDGIYRITRSDLEAAGATVSMIDPKTFQLFESGSEKEIYVSGESDNNFDENDYIEFVGERNYNENYRTLNGDSEEYVPYLNRYTDTTYCFLTWGNEQGKRMTVDTSPQNTNAAFLDYHNQLVHVEENNMYQNCNNDETANQTSNWKKNKAWYWGFLYTSSRNYSISIEDLYPEKAGKAYFRFTGYASNLTTNAHQVEIRFNGNEINSANVNRFSQAILTGEILPDDLNDGSNTFTIQNYANEATVNAIAIDWFEVEYPQYNVLTDDSLLITIPDGYSDDLVQVRITNANGSSYSILKYNDEVKKISSYTLQNGTLTFSDTVSSGEKYAVFANGKTLKAGIEYVGKFTNLTSDNSSADYIGITVSEFSSGVKDYLNTIESNYDLTTKLIDVEDIFNEFGYGYSTPESIKEFVEYAYDNWGAPKPSYLVLFGDACYDYKGYISTSTAERISENLVPAYGNPVSDNWYAIFDESVYIPQLKVGRIPILSLSELNYYKGKIEGNINSEYDDWNKRYILFSGGDESSSSQLKQLKAVNDSIKINVLEPRPVSGDVYHFYKTTDPITNRGSYTEEEYQSALDNGSMIISYIGHSGTSTWDNDITKVTDIQSKVDRYPVMSDFGCSTNKYAEPDILCFGEGFLLSDQGQAINYIGNSSLGFISTAVEAPKYFYDSLVRDSLNEVGNAHIYAKTKLYNRIGNSNLFKVFALSNTILGDPAVELKVPPKPNLKIDESSLLFSEEELTDISDSVKVDLIITNNGSAEPEIYTLSYVHTFNSEIVDQKTLDLTLPGYKDTLSIWISTKSKPGNHSLSVFLDTENVIDELDENDNSEEYSLNVYAVSLRDLSIYTNENSTTEDVRILSPAKYYGSVSDIQLQTSADIGFTKPVEHLAVLDTLFSTLALTNLRQNTRYWYRYKFRNDDEYSSPKSFFNSTDYDFYLSDSISFSKQMYDGVKYVNGSVGFVLDTIKITAYSAGWYDGKNGYIMKDDEELVGNIEAGMSIAVLDSATMAVDTTAWFFLFANEENARKLSDMIYNIEDGKIVAMVVSDDGQHVLFSSGLNEAIKTIGSSKIDSLKYRGSWAIIGRKGAEPGDPDIVEKITAPQNGYVEIQKDFIVNRTKGYLLTNMLGPAESWDSLYIDYNLPNSSSLSLTPIGFTTEGIADTLDQVEINSREFNLSEVIPDDYPYARLRFNFSREVSAESPLIYEIGAKHSKVPELAINYQTVSFANDSLDQGEYAYLQFRAGNAGEVEAQDVDIKVDLYNNNEFIRTLMDTSISSIAAESYQEIGLTYMHEESDGSGDSHFYIVLDYDNKIVEYYEDNNTYDIDFYGVPTSITAGAVSATFDGTAILDGDYVAVNPKIDIMLEYDGSFAIDDTSSMGIYLDGKRLNYSDLVISSSVRKSIVYSLQPELEDGEHTLSVYGENIVSADNSEESFSISFNVSGETKIIHVYNYPNPFTSDTYFTFELTQIPQELRINIYTIAGRLIREINVNGSQLGYDLNRVYWDGRDGDGDIIANGTYLYKIIVDDGEKRVSETGKLAVIR